MRLLMVVFFLANLYRCLVCVCVCVSLFNIHGIYHIYNHIYAYIAHCCPPISVWDIDYRHDLMDCFFFSISSFLIYTICFANIECILECLHLHVQMEWQKKPIVCKFLSTRNTASYRCWCWRKLASNQPIVCLENRCEFSLSLWNTVSIAWNIWNAGWRSLQVW